MILKAQAPPSKLDIMHLVAASVNGPSCCVMEVLLLCNRRNVTPITCVSLLASLVCAEAEYHHGIAKNRKPPGIDRKVRPLSVQVAWFWVKKSGASLRNAHGTLVLHHTCEHTATRERIVTSLGSIGRRSPPRFWRPRTDCIVCIWQTQETGIW